VASQKSSDRTGVFLAHLAVIAVMVVVLAVSFVVYTDTKWMHVEITNKAKKLQNLEEKVNQRIKELDNVTNRSGHRSQPDQ
jgi:predicted amino acid-binding ACT domain protein